MKRKGSGATSVPREVTAAEEVYRRLRAAVITCEFAPGAPLRLARLMQRYEVGISPLREALFRLAAERLVTSADFRGFRVAPVSAEEAADVTRLRILLESEALRLAILRGDHVWRDELAAAADALATWTAASRPDGGTDWATRHRAFHRALVSACASPWLLNFIDALFDQSERYRQLAIKRDTQQLSRDVDAEHRAILEAVMNSEPERAVDALARHYQRTLDSVIGSETGSPARQKSNGRADI